MLKRPCVHSRTEQLQASSTYSHPYVSEEHAFRIHMAPAEPLCLTPCCTEPQDKGDTGRANGRWACSHESDVPGYLNGPNLVHAVLADHQHPTHSTSCRGVGAQLLFVGVHPCESQAGSNKYQATLQIHACEVTGSLPRRCVLAATPQGKSVRLRLGAVGSKLKYTGNHGNRFVAGVSCFPSWGFMFSPLGFHVFPRGVSCFPLDA